MQIRNRNGGLRRKQIATSVYVVMCSLGYLVYGWRKK